MGSELKRATLLGLLNVPNSISQYLYPRYRIKKTLHKYIHVYIHIHVRIHYVHTRIYTYTYKYISITTSTNRITPYGENISGGGGGNVLFMHG